MELYLVYKSIEHFDEDERPVLVAKDVFGENRCYLQDYYGYEILLKKEIDRFKEIEYNNQVSDEIKNNVATLSNKHSNITQQLIGKNNTIFNNLKTLKIYNTDNKICKYNTVGNEIIINTSAEFINARLAHEVGHLEFTEYKIDLVNKTLNLFSGVATQKLSISSPKVLTDNDAENYFYKTPKEYTFIETTFSSPINIGLEEFLNDAKSSKLEYNSLYPSIGIIIETMVGEKTCVLARATHNVSLISEKLLEIVNNKELVNNLYLNMDNYFTTKKEERQKTELRLFKTVSPFIVSYLNQNSNASQHQKNILLDWHYVHKQNATEISQAKQKCLQQISNNKSFEKNINHRSF